MRRANFRNSPATRRKGVAGFLLGIYNRNKTYCILISYIFCHLSCGVFAHSAYALEIGSNSYKVNTILLQNGGGLASSVNQNALFGIGENIVSLGSLSSANFLSWVGGLYGLSELRLVQEIKLTLDLKAFTDIIGDPILEKLWQKDNDPYFYWSISLEAGEPVKGYAVSLDIPPEEKISTETSFYQFPEHSVSSGKHTFYVLPYLQNKGWDKANMAKFEVWVDADVPIIRQVKPLSGQLVKDNLVPITCVLYDSDSGLDLSRTTLTVNNSAVNFTYDAKEETLKAAPSAPFSDEKNTVLLKAYDLVGNYVVKAWDFIVDVRAPSGNIMINNGEEFSHSAYVSISIKAEDIVSGIKYIYLSNDGVFDAELTHPYPYAPVIYNWVVDQPDLDGTKTIYVRFEDYAGNMSGVYQGKIKLKLLTGDTRIISGPKTVEEDTEAHFKFDSSKSNSQFSYRLDNLDWSIWLSSKEADFSGLTEGNHYFYVKSAFDLNGDGKLSIDEEDATAAQWTWAIKAAGESQKIPKKILFWRR